jgi:hypothetical protein
MSTPLALALLKAAFKVKVGNLHRIMKLEHDLVTRMHSKIKI